MDLPMYEINNNNKFTSLKTNLHCFQMYSDNYSNKWDTNIFTFIYSPINTSSYMQCEKNCVVKKKTIEAIKKQKININFLEHQGALYKLRKVQL